MLPVCLPLPSLPQAEGHQHCVFFIVVRTRSASSCPERQGGGSKRGDLPQSEKSGHLTGRIGRSHSLATAQSEGGVSWVGMGIIPS